MENLHRKPPSPKLADLIMPAIKAREKARSEAAEKQASSCAPQESQPAPAAGGDTTEGIDGEASSASAEASAAGEAVPAEVRR